MEKILNKWFPTFWITVSIILYLLILITSQEIDSTHLEFSGDGLNLFVEIFKIPLYFFAAGIPIYGIILTFRRINQTDDQLNILNHQINRGEKTSFENNFFQLLEILRIFINNLDLKKFGTSGKGRVVFRQIKQQAQRASNYSDFLRNNVDEGGIFLKMYFNQIYNILLLIDEKKNIISPNYYINILASQLSVIEIELIQIHYKKNINIPFSKLVNVYKEKLFEGLN
jgi:hypothetical protein